MATRSLLDLLVSSLYSLLVQVLGDYQLVAVIYKIKVYKGLFKRGITILLHFSFPLFRASSKYILKREGERQQPCLSPFMFINPCVTLFPTLIFVIDWLERLLTALMISTFVFFRVCQSFFTETLVYAFFRSKNRICISWYRTIFFSIIWVRKYYLRLIYPFGRPPVLLLPNFCILVLFNFSATPKIRSYN